MSHSLLKLVTSKYVAEYAGIAVGLNLLEIPTLLGLLVAYIVKTIIVVTKEYRRVEIILLSLSFLVLGGSTFNISLPL